MQVFWSETQLSYAGAHFFQRGRLVESPEKPERAERIIAELRTRAHNVAVPEDLGIAPISAVHTPDYLDFLQSIHAQWTEVYGADSLVIPNVFGDVPPHATMKNLVGKLGSHTGDLACEIMENTWAASYASAQCATNAAAFTLRTGQPSYTLCRPPGHHASAAKAMGFCYLNNSAIAAQMMRERYERVAILDVDVHHGNGTQSIFYDRGDVFTGSIHSDPTDFYPFFNGHESETGSGAGSGFNCNICYPKGSGDEHFLDAFSRLRERTQSFVPQALVVAFGVDALSADPHGEHTVTPTAFEQLAKQIKDFDLPTVIVQEGGYLSDDLAPTVAGFLEVFDHD